jgi:Domain of unknown function (DUF222)/HNH endonuclease
MCSTETKPLEELEREICELSAHIAAAMCRFLILLAEWDQRGGWCEWGCRSCAQWLSWRCSITPGAARERMRVARRLTELELVREAFAAGELSYSKVRAVTRVATPQTQEQLVHLARHATGAQLEKLVRSYRGVLSATLGAAQDAFDARYVSWRWEDDGSFSIRARLPADEGALLLQALEAAKALAPAYVDDGPPIATAAVVHTGPTAAEREADALVAVARASLQQSGDVRSGGDPCQLVVHVDAATLDSDEVRVRSELAGGPSLAPETVRRLGCDAALVRIVERDGEPLSIGRRTRTIPPALRRALRSRDHGCRFPGCAHERFLHAHHIKHWARGGPTSVENLVTLCSYHHRLVHESGFDVERAGREGVRFRRPDGRLVPSVGDGGRAHGPNLVARQRAAGIGIDERTCRALSAGDSLDYSIAVDGLLARELEGT